MAQKSECERVWEREFPFGRARGGAYTFNSFPRLWRGCWDIKSRKEEESLVLRGKKAIARCLKTAIVRKCGKIGGKFAWIGRDGFAVRTVPQMPENRTAGLSERAIAPRNTVAGGVKIMSREARAE